MNDKNKAIEEMAKIIDQAQKQGYQRIFEETRKFVQENHRYSSKNDYDKAHSQTIDEIIAEALYNAGYFKGGKDEEVAVVSEDLPPKDQEKERSIDEKIAKACKETAREFLQWIMHHCPNIHDSKIKEIAKRYGVEVER